MFGICYQKRHIFAPLLRRDFSLGQFVPARNSFYTTSAKDKKNPLHLHIKAIASPVQARQKQAQLFVCSRFVPSVMCLAIRTLNVSRFVVSCGFFSQYARLDNERLNTKKTPQKPRFNLTKGEPNRHSKTPNSRPTKIGLNKQTNNFIFYISDFEWFSFGFAKRI